MPSPTEHARDSRHGTEVLRELSPQHRELRRVIPDAYKGFGELSKAAFAPGALDRKTKELIALAIGVVEGCDGCIASHGRAAAHAGATRAEAAEAIGVTFLMGGGPATIHGARAYDTFCEFADALDAHRRTHNTAASVVDSPR
ncbi:carboxymuconolactone decarboxylase family protein [Nocardia grenadensis]|uniref:carboxymuconolactone decarboxylase family protein n=1 Tax=Nocardia grenadensis TaxID=931537 RepID=UPI003D745008